MNTYMIELSAKPYVRMMFSGCGREHIRNKKDPGAGGTEKLPFRIL